MKIISLFQNIAKGTMDPRVEFISRVITQILIKQFQNFDKALTSKSQPNISILTKLKLKILAKPSFIILTKIQLCNSTKHQQQNTDQTSASKSCLNFNLNLDQSAQSLNKSWALYEQTPASESATNCCQHTIKNPLQVALGPH